MPTSAVCSITDPIESIKARVDVSLAKMDAADGQTQRTWRPQSAQSVTPKPRSRPPASRPSTAASCLAPPHHPSVAANTTAAAAAAAAASRDLLNYARQRFECAIAAEDHTAASAENGFLIEADSPPSGLSVASHLSRITSKTQMSAYVTLTSSTASGGSSASLPPLPRAEQEQHELRLRLLNEIRVRSEKQRVRLWHDRVAQELCQEGALPSKTAVFAFNWPDYFQWRVQAEPQFERQRKAALERLAERLRAAPDLPEPERVKEEEQEKEPAPLEGKSKRRTRGPFSVSSIGSAEKRQVQSSVRRVEKEVGKLRAEAAAARLAEEEASRRLEEQLTAAAEAEPGPGVEIGVSEAAQPTAKLVTAASQRQLDVAAEKADSLGPPVSEDEVETKEGAHEVEEDGVCGKQVADSSNDQLAVPDFLCPSSEEKSRQHEVRLWLRKTSYSNAPDFLPIY